MIGKFKKLRWLHSSGYYFVFAMLLMIMFTGMVQADGGIFQMVGNITVTEDKVIDGDVDALAGNITIYGTVNGNVTALAGNITIYGKVNGDVRNTAGNVYIRNTGEVNGKVTALAGRVFQDEDSKIQGSVVEMIGDESSDSSEISFGNMNINIRHLRDNVFISPRVPWYFYMWGGLTGLIGWLALGALLMLFFAGQVNRLGDIIQKRPGYYFLVGLVSYLLVPPLMILLVITIIGIPLALLLIPLIFLSTLYGQLGVARIIGVKVITSLNLKFSTEMSKVLIGIASMAIITLIPVLGWVFFFITACMGLGSVVINRFGFEKKEKKEDYQIEE
ncbi:MAG: polymer-forming cytoskeletal protein [Halanaerobiales bacterium]|nr:polymer-forming cytoskeletal protein [Halanaerobiales bacterium]